MGVTAVLISLKSKLSITKRKFGQIVVRGITNVSNTFLAECWRLEISYGPGPLIK